MTAPFSHNRKVIPIDEARLRKELDDRPVPISQKIAERAMEADGLGRDPATLIDAEVLELRSELNAMQRRLDWLHGAIEPQSLAGSVLGLIGNSAEDMRTQIAPLREAVKNEAGDAA